MMALLLIISLPVSGLADTYDLAIGSVTVDASESGQTVTQENNPDRQNYADSNPIITGTTTENTVTITADAGATANVTLSGVNIDVSTTGIISPSDNIPGEAAVQAKGDGNVTIELDGENTVKSGNERAGVEKNNGGNLTITNTDAVTADDPGSLHATGSYGGAGVGGAGVGGNSNGSNITITGNANVTASGYDAGAGIGGGGHGSGSDITIEGNAKVEAKGGSNSAAGIGGGENGSGSGITIRGNAEVTATGGYSGAGIGGGDGGDGSDITIAGNAAVTATGGYSGAGIGGGDGGDGNDITITGNAAVTATGGPSGAGIGGGENGSGSGITVSGDAQVKAQGGENNRGAGAAIGEGAKWSGGNHDFLNGAEVSPDTGKLTANGKIEYYAPNANMETDSPIKVVTGTYVPPQPSESAAEDAQPAPLYRVLGKNGQTLACQTVWKDGVLTITVDADFATLTGTLGGIQSLKAQGIDTIVFAAKAASASFALSDLLAQGNPGDSYKLTHDGETVSFTLGVNLDIRNILK